jgi:hypothetical protein
MSRAVILLSLCDLMMWTEKISLFMEGSSQDNLRYCDGNCQDDWGTL